MQSQTKYNHLLLCQRQIYTPTILPFHTSDFRNSLPLFWPSQFIVHSLSPLTFPCHSPGIMPLASLRDIRPFSEQCWLGQLYWIIEGQCDDHWPLGNWGINTGNSGTSRVEDTWVCMYVHWSYIASTVGNSLRIVLLCYFIQTIRVFSVCVHKISMFRLTIWFICSGAALWTKLTQLVLIVDFIFITYYALV